MRILDRYLAIFFLKNLALALLALSALFALQSVLGEMINGDFPPKQIVVHQLLNLPKVMVEMCPPTVMAATLMTLGGLNRSHELTAYFSVGVGLKRISSVLLAFVFILSCVLLILQDHVLPPLFKARTNYYWRIMKQKPDFYMDLRQDKIWYRSRNMIYNLRTFDPLATTIRGLSIYAFNDNFKLIEFIEAEKAVYRNRAWSLERGTVTIFPQDSDFPLSQEFQIKELLINEKPQDFLEIEKQDEGLRIRELWQYIGRLKASGVDAKSYETRFFSRFSMSLIPIVMCLLAIPFAITNQRAGGVAKDIGICLGTTFIYWMFHSLSLSLGINGSIPPMASALVPSLLFATIAGALHLRRWS